MQYDFAVNGRTRHVVVVRDGERFAVTIDGETWSVDAARVDGSMMSLLVGAGDSFEVTLSPDEASGLTAVRVGPMRTLVGQARGRRPGQQADVAGGSGPQRLTAPMPGKIVRVLVEKGEVVHARQAVIVVEAMKMENELRAGRDGTVADIHAREGQSVEAGTLLVVIQ